MDDPSCLPPGRRLLALCLHPIDGLDETPTANALPDPTEAGQEQVRVVLALATPRIGAWNPSQPQLLVALLFGEMGDARRSGQGRPASHIAQDAFPKLCLVQTLGRESLEQGPLRAVQPPGQLCERRRLL